MEYNEINWDKIPDELSKEQFHILCHISKATAKYLLDNRKVPCKISHKSTHKYKIKKTDVIEYLIHRDNDPDFYAQTTTTRPRYNRCSHIPVDTDMTVFFTEAMTNCPDVMTARYISELTGYQSSTVNKWHLHGHLKGFIKNKALYVPKIYLIEFFNSPYFKNLPQKNSWHRQMGLAFIKSQ